MSAAARADDRAVIVPGPLAEQQQPLGHGSGTFLRHPIAVASLAVTLAVVALTRYPIGARGLIAAFMAVVLVVVAATDLERRIIPNRVVLPAIAIVLLARAAFFPNHALEFVLAALGAALFLLLPNLINSAAIGMGDMKLGLLLGVGLGLGVVGALMVAFVSIFPFALGKVVRGGLAARKATLPFGPFLAFGGLVILIVPRLVGLGAS